MEWCSAFGIHLIAAWLTKALKLMPFSGIPSFVDILLGEQPQKNIANKQAYGLNHRAFAIYGSRVVGRQCPNIGRDHNE